MIKRVRYKRSKYNILHVIYYIYKEMLYGSMQSSQNKGKLVFKTQKHNFKSGNHSVSGYELHNDFVRSLR